MPNVLLIDDDDLLRTTLRVALDRLGYAVAEARNGQEGLRLLAERPTDLVITDILMPEKEGIETIMELNRSGRGVKIIAMSGGGRGGACNYLSVAKRLGAAGILEKPFTLEQMSATISRVLGDAAVQPVCA